MLLPVPGKRTFTIHTAKVGPSGSDFVFEVPDAWLGPELEGCDASPTGRSGEISVNASPISPGYYLSGTIHVHLGATCVRCLRTASLDLSVPFKVHMVSGPERQRDDEETVGEDGSLGTAHYQGEEMVLDSLVRESIVLALPMNPRCPEGCSLEDLYRDED
jgi:uncharacterized metal-binding protein YceD (DUF177 family)